jgi:serine/threonine-protein kinase
MTPESPRIVGRYAIFDEIASGGMATVYLGRLMGAGGFARTVAIKRLHPQFAKDPEFVTMFLDEARLAARIRHPNVVPTLDVVAAKGELFLVMEYVQGESLSRLARALKTNGERVPIPILLRIMSDALQGLHAAHEARDERGLSLEIVHRDVTPQNILVGVDGVGRLLDFGVAKAVGRAHTTREGQLKGKLGYMAPEQLRMAGVTRQTDVYAASVVLWELLTGERLFSGASEVDVIAKLLKRDIQLPSKLAPGVPKALDDIVMRGLAADVNERYATARDLCVALATCGMQEAAGIVVGEWVQGLAAQALALRSAKVAAIETHTDTSNVGAAHLNPVSSPPPSASMPVAAPHTSQSIPTLSAAIKVPARGVASGEAPTDVTSPTMSATAIRRGVRSRVLGVAAVVAACVAIVAFAFARGGKPDETATAASASAVASAPPPPTTVRIPPPPPASAVAVATVAPPEVAPAAPPPPPQPRPGSPRAAAPSSLKPAPAVRPQRTAPSPSKASDDSVFDRRE